MNEGLGAEEDGVCLCDAVKRARFTSTDHLDSPPSAASTRTVQPATDDAYRIKRDQKSCDLFDRMLYSPS